MQRCNRTLLCSQAYFQKLSLLCNEGMSNEPIFMIICSYTAEFNIKKWLLSSMRSVSCFSSSFSFFALAHALSCSSPCCCCLGPSRFLHFCFCTSSGFRCLFPWKNLFLPTCTYSHSVEVICESESPNITVKLDRNIFLEKFDSDMNEEKKY